MKKYTFWNFLCITLRISYSKYSNLSCVDDGKKNHKKNWLLRKTVKLPNTEAEFSRIAKLLSLENCESQVSSSFHRFTLTKNTQSDSL